MLVFKRICHFIYKTYVSGFSSVSRGLSILLAQTMRLSTVQTLNICRLCKLSTYVDYANSQHMSTMQTLNTCRPCKLSTRVDYANSQHVSTLQTLDMCRPCKHLIRVNSVDLQHVSTDCNEIGVSMGTCKSLTGLSKTKTLLVIRVSFFQEIYIDKHPVPTVAMREYILASHIVTGKRQQIL